MGDDLNILKQREIDLKEKIDLYDEKTRNRIYAIERQLSKNGTYNRAIYVSQDALELATQHVSVKKSIQDIEGSNKRTTAKKNIRRPVKKDKLPEDSTSFFGSIFRAIGNFFKRLFGRRDDSGAERNNKRLKRKVAKDIVVPASKRSEVLPAPPTEGLLPETSDDYLVAMRLNEELNGTQEDTSNDEALALQLNYELNGYDNKIVEEEKVDKKIYFTLEEKKYRTEKEEYKVQNGQYLMDVISNKYGPKSKQMEYFFSNDVKVIQEGIREFKDKIPEMGNFLRKRLVLLKKIDYYKKDEVKSEPGKIVGKDGKEVVIDQKDLYNKNKSYMLTGVSFAGRQTTGVGCWSVSLATQLQYRGMEFSQQDVRLFRPVGINAENYSDTGIDFIGKNIMGSAVEFAQMMNICKKNMAVHQVTAANLSMKPYLNYSVKQIEQEEERKAQKDPNYKKLTQQEILQKKRQNDMELAKIKKQDIEYMRKRIIDGLVVHRSPVSLLYNGHYVTVYGIEGNTVYYYNSLSDRRDGKESATLEDLYAAKFELTWFEELKPESKDKCSSLDSQIEKYVEFKDGELQKVQLPRELGEKVEDNLFNTDVVTVECDKTVNDHVDGMKKDGIVGQKDEFEVSDRIYIPKKISA